MLPGSTDATYPAGLVLEDWLPRPGSVVDGRFRIEDVIGAGGMGAVMAARHVALDEPVAIKFLRPERARTEESLARFMREAKAAARIKSEHVVRVRDVGTTEDGLSFLVMERLEGTDLGRLARDRPLPLPLAADCVLQAAEAIAEAHRAGIVHRDLKPANLWLGRRVDGAPHVKVLDFGISKLVEDDPHRGELTETQAVFGSPTYMSPEQIRSAKHVDPRTDVWALGVVLFELLTAERPFEADSVPGLIAAILTDPPRSLRALRADVPAPVERLVLDCLTKEPDRRATLADVARVLAPHASAAGQVAGDRVLGMFPAAALATSRSDNALVLETPIPARATEPRAARSIGLVLTGAVGVVLVAGAVALFARRAPHRDDAPTAASATPTASATETATATPGASDREAVAEPSLSASSPAPSTVPTSRASSVRASHARAPSAPRTTAPIAEPQPSSSAATAASPPSAAAPPISTITSERH